MPEGTEVKEEKRVDLDAIVSGFSEIKQSLEAEKMARAGLEGQLREIKTQAVPPAQQAAQPKRYSRADLKMAVEAGTITQEQADGYIDQLRTEDFDKKLAAGIENAKNDIVSDVSLQTELDRYVAAVPDIMVEGSEERNRVQAEYSELIGKFKNPEGIRTQLLALRNTIGPVPAGGRTDLAGEREHDRTGAGGGNAGKSEAKSDPLNGLDVAPRVRDHYRKLVDKGVTTWDKARAELEPYKQVTA